MSEPRKILIVEDDLGIRKLYTLKLSAHGFDIETAIDGIEGLKKAQEFQPDLILLDLKMPHMNGEEMLAEMRASDWGEHIKVVILTNTSREEAPIGLKNLNIEQYVVKAMYTPAQVLEIVENTLNKD